jgi:NAD(P)-dependent dehydrogenase (short-subunit alcohol dehydrogenase family)
MNKYIKQYKWSNIFTMLHNQKLDPEVCKETFNNHLVVITGSTSGIGHDAAKKYASLGADILSINRNEEKTKKLCEELKHKYGTDCTYMIADFSNLDQVHNVAKKLASLERNIDVLIHNAGVYVTQRTITEDDLEQVFQTNYLSTFIINYYIKDKFIKQNNGRIIFVNSEGHRFAAWGLHLDDLKWENHSYSGLKSYGAAKLAQLLSMIKFNEYFLGTKVTINAMHPGNVKTNSGENNGKFYKFYNKMIIDRNAISIENSSEALYYLGVSNKVENTSGKFFNLTTEEIPAPPSLDREEAERLWILSIQLGGLK